MKHMLRHMVDWALMFVALYCSGSLISQGVSFARWSPGAMQQQLVDKHADLIATGGVGLFALTLLASRLMVRLTEIEEHAQPPKEHLFNTPND